MDWIRVCSQKNHWIDWQCQTPDPKFSLRIMLMGVRRGAQEGALAGQNSMFSTSY